jgi:hypothetical protein
MVSFLRMNPHCPLLSSPISGEGAIFPLAPESGVCDWEGHRATMETVLRKTFLTAAELTCVCCNCHRERTDKNEWREHHPVAGERLSHGICPRCLYELYPDIAPQIHPRAPVAALT